MDRPIVKELWIVTFIHQLYMKFPKEYGIATVRVTKCDLEHLNSLRKAKPYTFNIVLDDNEIINAFEEGQTHSQGKDIEMIDVPKEWVIFDELDPRIIEAKL